MPSDSAQGRFWNEGLAFYGWIFYLSKFYEVLDTLIILAKGKQSSTLQTYHHAGAMLCMWAGIRYMASPIWVFAFVNSAIHAMMVSPPPPASPAPSFCPSGSGRKLFVLTWSFSTPTTPSPPSASGSPSPSSAP